MSQNSNGPVEAAVDGEALGSGEVAPARNLHPGLSQLINPDASTPAPAFPAKHGMYGDGTTSPDTSGFGGLVREPELPAASTPPFGGWFDDVAGKLGELVPGCATRVVVYRDQITFFIDRARLREVAQVLRDGPGLRFEVCTSVSGVHYPRQQGAELHIVYQLLSITHNRRISLEVEIPDADPHVPSLVPVYPMVNFHERETWDMFGIIFDGHPGLTRLLMPDDWVGHPQRKDYPLGGIPIEYKGAVVPPPDQRRSYQ